MELESTIDNWTETSNHPPQAMSVSVSVATSSNEQPKFNRVILKEDGRNFLAWKAILPIYLQSSLYAWEVVQGEINPLDNAEAKKHYELGNQSGREIIFSTLHENTVLTLFFEDSVYVTAKDAWTRINERFVGTSNVFADIAVSKFTSFRFNPEVPIHQNLKDFQSIMYELQETNAGITAKGVTARLVSCLPREWEAFKLAWGVKDEKQKKLYNLIEMIIAEDARRKSEMAQDRTTDNALIARAGGSSHYRRRINTRRSTEIECWNCRKKGHIARFCREKRSAEVNSAVTF